MMCNNVQCNSKSCEHSSLCLTLHHNAAFSLFCCCNMCLHFCLLLGRCSLSLLCFYLLLLLYDVLNHIACDPGAQVPFEVGIGDECAWAVGGGVFHTHPSRFTDRAPIGFAHI